MYQQWTQAWVWREETEHLECAGSFRAKGVVKGWVHSKHTNTYTHMQAHTQLHFCHTEWWSWSAVITPYHAFSTREDYWKKKVPKKQKLDLKHLSFNQTASRSKDVSTAGVFRDGLDFFFLFSMESNGKHSPRVCKCGGCGEPAVLSFITGEAVSVQQLLCRHIWKAASPEL